MSPSSYAFDGPDADVILRAPLQPGSDEFKDFRVHKLILSIASTVFRDTFSIPQPPPPTSEDTSLDVVQITESAEVVETFLQLTYPIDPPVIADLQLLDDLLQLADKYIAGGVITKLKKLLVTPAFLNDDPIRVYALACRNGFEEETKVAVQHTFSIDVVRQISEEHIRMMPTKTYHRLLTEHAIRQDLLVDAVDVTWVRLQPFFRRTGCSCFDGLKGSILLGISQKPFLDRDLLDTCFAAAGRRPPCAGASLCIQHPEYGSTFLSSVMRGVQNIM